jgi:hypothetical protein
MCTMTWIRETAGYQVFFNRDERRTRKPAIPPAIRTKGSRRFIAPLDGDFGGSWIGVNDRGVSLCLLNAYAGSAEECPEPATGYTSRGLLLTGLIDARSAMEVSERLRTGDLERFRAFLLVAFVDDDAAVLSTWRAGRLTDEELQGDHLPLVSSSFDTVEVVESRRALFHESTRLCTNNVERHLMYHESHRPERGAHSPCMHRPDAKTVSFSHIRVDRSRVCFDYSPHAPCRGRPKPPPLCIRRER